MPIAWYLPRFVQMAILAVACVAAVGLALARRRAGFPWARPLQTGFRWAWITLLVMILLKSANVVPAIIFGSGLIPQMLALYEIATIVLLAAVAFTFGLSVTGLRQAWREEAHDSPGVPAARRRARELVWFGTPLLLLALGLVHEAQARGLEARLRRAESGEEEARAAARSVWCWIDPRVGAWIAGSRQTPPEVLTDFAHSPMERTRANVAWNPRTPLDVIRMMAGDRLALVRVEAARNQSAPDDLLLALSHDEDESVRVAVAWNPQTPPALLASLAHDASPQVRYQIAAHAQAPANVLEALSSDPELANPLFPYISRVRITVPCFTETVKSGVAGNAATPAALLERLARDPDCAVRRKVATNKNVPAEILHALQNDADPSVKTSATMALQAPPARP